MCELQNRITSYNVCYTKLLRIHRIHPTSNSLKRPVDASPRQVGSSPEQFVPSRTNFFDPTGKVERPIASFFESIGRGDRPLSSFSQSMSKVDPSLSNFSRFTSRVNLPHSNLSSPGAISPFPTCRLFRLTKKLPDLERNIMKDCKLRSN